ncbi:archaetidylserine synthase [Methanobrevibacter curvatus]|uniref:CDP-alcohol phosphatidyltransferase n=1 Tax=Methanobrevibacter curvatus TaxID=49547 RepID=A0A166DL29_9EURY|nr:archaetidylserine synthase [Methanobrevibacter curvatus]KZX15709.1 CDP-alcohol phosphatidyltransferase [Methanobrevibacter curvatus]
MILKKFSMEKFVAIPDLISLLNMICGFLAIISAIKHEYDISSLFIIFAIIFDSVDGWIARKIGRAGETDFGKNIDSLSDAVSFGVAPGVLLYVLSLENTNLVVQTIGLLVALFTVVCGILRLTRFNVIADKVDFKGFVGLPIPLHGLILISLVLSGAFNLYLAFILMIITGILMISAFKYPKLNDLKVIVGGGILIFLIIIEFLSPFLIISDINIPALILFIFSLMLSLTYPLKSYLKNLT